MSRAFNQDLTAAVNRVMREHFDLYFDRNAADKAIRDWVKLKLPDLFDGTGRAPTPAEGEVETIKRMARAMQKANRPTNAMLNSEQQDARESETLPAYMKLAKAALASLRSGEVRR